MKKRIIRGADFSDIIQITTQPNGQPLGIVGSTTANPSVIETDLPHEISTNDKVYLWGHRKNTIVNGNFTATKVDAFKFSVPVTGVIAGEIAGEVGKCIDATGYAVSVALKNRAGGTAITGVTLTLTWIDQSIFRFKISITDTHSALIDNASVVAEVKYTDTAGYDRLFVLEYDVKDA